MKRIAILIFFAVNSAFIFAQIPLAISGTVTNSSETGNWDGVNIQRNVVTSLIFRNNSISSVNNSGYMLQAGDEGISGANNNLDGEIITGNKLIWNGSDNSGSITHGIFTGYNINATVIYNYLNKIPMAIIRKSNGMTNTAGGVGYNIVNKTGATAIVVKGMNGVNIFNNTIYSDQVLYTGPGAGTWRGLVEIYSNTDITPSGASTGTKIKNNIFYTKNQIYNIYIYDTDCLPGFESDYNVYYCEGGTPMFNYLGTSKTFAQWQALGYDTHSKVINPNFIDFTDFVPASRLDYGTDLGAGWKTGLSTKAVWTVGISPLTADQNGTWQVGARVYTELSPVTIKMTISPNHAHKIINVLLAYTGSLSAQTAIITPEIIRIVDLSGNLFFEKLLVKGVSSLKIPLNLDPGIYTVLMMAGDLVMDSQKMVVY